MGHSNNVAENVRAREALGDDPNLECYRRTKEQERMEADEMLANMEAACDADIARMNARWAEQQARHKADIHDMRDDVHNLQAVLTEKRAQAEETLSRQTTEHRQILEELDAKLAAEFQHFEGLRQHKQMALRSAVSQARQQMMEASV